MTFAGAAPSGWPRGLARFIAVMTVLVAVAAVAPSARAARLAGFEYLSPSPGARWVSPGHTIALRRSDGLRESDAAPPQVTVVGSSSGPLTGAWTLADDSRTWVFAPAVPFALGETVTVTLSARPGAVSGDIARDRSYSFSVTSQVLRPVSDGTPGGALEQIVPDAVRSPDGVRSRDAAAPARLTTPQPCDTFPMNYLPATVSNWADPDPGHIFLSLVDQGTGGGGHLQILDNYGHALFNRQVTTGASDFTRQDNGQLTYYSAFRRKYFVMDSSYVIVDSVGTGNGYVTDGHELVWLPNGHWLLMSYDPQPVDMSVIVPGGNPNAIVTGLIIQELDAAKNVVFQWRSWDHFLITDMIETATRLLTNATIDYSHGNAIEPDLDGHLLISSRHMNEITKINRQTGDIIWRLGLNAKNNDFTFVNDTRGFSHQHDIRRLPNGNITLYDNGNFLSPQYSRAVEYSLDEQNLIATQVWEFRQTPDNFGPATGSARRSASGGTLISWGLGAVNPKVSDVHADGSKALELTFETDQIYSYRARRLPWRTNRFVPDAEALDFGTTEVGSQQSLPLSIHNPTASPVELTCFVSSDPQVSVNESVPVVVPAGGDVPLTVTFAPTALGALDARLYLRSSHGVELIAQMVQVTAEVVAVGGVGSGGSGPVWLSVRPNPGSGERTLTFGLAEAGPVTLEIFDLNGRCIATPYSAVTPAGTRQIVWPAGPDASNLESGLYFAKLTTPAGVRTRKLVTLSR